MDEPNQNIMILDQVEGTIKVALKLLDKIDTNNTYTENEKQGYIWTLDGWRKHNLKHLRKAFE